MSKFRELTPPHLACLQPRSQGTAQVVAVASPRSTPRRVVTLAVFAALVGLHLWLSRGMVSPIIQPDEGSYLGISHFLLSGSGLSYVYREAQHSPGYSLVLLPAELVFRRPLAVYRAALVLNSFLLASVMLAALALIGQVWPDATFRRRIVIATLVALYPAFLVDSNVAMSMNLFIPLLMLTAAAIAWACRDGTWRRWFTAGALSGGLMTVSPLGLPVLVALVAVTVGGRRPFAHRARDALPLLLGMQAAALPVVVLTGRTIASAPTSGARLSADPARAPTSRTAYTAAHVLGAVHQGHWASKLSELAGQVLYLTVGTYGLFVVGMIVSAVAVKRVFIDGSPEVADRVAAIAGPAMAGTIVASSLLTDSGSTVFGSELLIFGRYNENVLGPILLLGLWALTDNRLQRQTARRHSSLVAVVAVVAAVSGLVLRLGRSSKVLAGPIGPIDVLALHIPLALLGRIDVGVLALGGACIAASVVVLARRAGTAGVCFVLMPLFLGSALFSAHRLAADSARRRSRMVIAGTIAAIRNRVPGRPSCIGYDDTGTYVWYVDNYAFLLPELRFQEIDPRTESGPCATLVITAASDFPLRVPGAELLAHEVGVPLTLWLRPPGPSG